EIKGKELPEFDDEFVQDISEKETVAEYIEETRETIGKRLIEEADKDVDNQISEKLIALAQGDILEQMYENQANEMVRDFEMRLRSQGMDPKMYMQYMGMDEAAIKNMYMEDAEKRVKLRLVLEAIAKQEGVEVTEADLEEEYSKMAEAYKVDVEKAKAAVPVESLTEDIKVQKALEIVKNSAVIK
ncbi:MAG: trigger factor, partial [Ruminococcus sp.]|nr:trigger factor [Ruminococcus sp.]